MRFWWQIQNCNFSSLGTHNCHCAVSRLKHFHFSVLNHLKQGSDRIDSFWFTWPNHFIFDSDSFWCKRIAIIYFEIWFSILIRFDLQFILIFIYCDFRFELILFILIRFDFDLSGFMIHLRIKIKSNKKSKIGESWFTHLRIINRFDFESKANQSESRIKLRRALTWTPKKGNSRTTGSGWTSLKVGGIKPGFVVISSFELISQWLQQDPTDKVNDRKHIIDSTN